MRSLPAALTWEVLHRGRWALLASFAGVLLFPLLIFGALKRDGALDPAEPGLIMVQVILTQVGILGLGSAIFTALGAPSRMFTHPISTSGIALCHLVPAGLLAAAMWGTCVTLLNMFLPLNWPIAGPALFAAVAVPSVLAASWYADRSVWLPFCIAIVAGILFLWLKARYGGVFSTSDHFWHRVTAGELLFLAVMGVGAYFVGVAGIARQRRHDPLPGVRFVEWLERVLEGSPAENLRFRSAEKAQLWAEWRTKGILLPGLLLFVATVAFVGWLIFSRDTVVLRQALLGSSVMLPITAMLVGLAIGNFGPNDSNSAMGPWLASRPLTSPSLARIVLINQFLSVASTTVVWHLAVWLTSAFGGRRGDDVPLLWLAHANWVLPWAAASIGMLVCLTGRSGWIAIGFSITTVVFLAGSVFVVGWVGGADATRAFLAGVLLVLAIIVVVGTVLAFVAARRRRMISTGVVAGSVFAFACLSSLLVWRLSVERHLDVVPLVVGLGIVAWCFAPLAMAPLAVAWNRHR